MLPTPDLSHLVAEDYRHVYEPSEDSFLLLDALEEDMGQLRAMEGAMCVEIGSGSGVVTAFLGKHMGPTHLYLTTDVNPYAAMISRKTGVQNNVSSNSVMANLISGLRIHGSVDVLVFNPPYVVTPSEEVYHASRRSPHHPQRPFPIEAAWAGGKDGREVIDALLPHLHSLLSPRGVFYLVVLAQNKPHNIIDLVEQQSPTLKGHVAMSRKAGMERLSILKFYRVPSK